MSDEHDSGQPEVSPVGTIPEPEGGGPEPTSLRQGDESRSDRPGADLPAARGPADGGPVPDATGEPGPPGPEGEAGGAGVEQPPGEVAEAGEAGESGESGEGAADLAARRARRRPRDPAVARAYRLGLPVEGRVEQVIKGGYEVRVGRSRGFCPHSQIDLHRVEDPEEHLSKTYSFQILQMRRGGEDLVLSRRALLEEEKADEAKAVRATLLEGTVMLGRVAGLADFGAFVDLGAGVMGLVHLSELSHARVTRVADAVSVGDRVRVKILKLDEGTGRISLSMRQAEEDPWQRIARDFQPGRSYPGTILRLSPFGAFVDVGPGVEALAPSREFPPVRGGWPEGVTVGDSRPWTVLSVEPERRRMTVAPASEGEPAPTLAPGARLSGKVQKVERFGVFVWLAPGKVGLVPAAMTGVPRGIDLARRFEPGQDLEVEIAEIGDEGRIRLSLPGVDAIPAQQPRAPHPPRRSEHRPAARQGERAPSSGRPPRRAARMEHSEPPAEPPGSGGFGTSLGDLLRAAFDKKGDAGS